MKPFKYLIYVVLGVIALAYLMYRAVGAALIFQQDALKDDLVSEMIKIHTPTQRFVLPLNHPNSVEIGEKLQYFVNLKSRDVRVFNFWELPHENRDSVSRYDDAVLPPPTHEQIKYVDESKHRTAIWHFDLYGHIDQSDANQNSSPLNMNGALWHSDFLHEGDYLIVSHGSPFLSIYNIRGAGLFARTLATFISNLPFELKLVASVSRSIGVTNIGWSIYKIESFVEVPKHIVGGLPLIFDEDNLFSSSCELKGSCKVELLKGWHDLEIDNGNAFRWASAETEISISQFPNRTCDVYFDLEPLLKDELPLMVNFNTKNLNETFELERRKKIKITIPVGKAHELIKISAVGGYDNPPGKDTRILKFRAFSFKIKNCKNLTEVQ